MRNIALALSGLALVLVACTADPTGDIKGASSPNAPEGSKDTRAGTPSSSSNNNGSTNGTSTNGTSTNGTSATPGTDGGATTTPPDPNAGAQCAAKADMGSCFDCCAAAAPGGQDVLGQAWSACACAADKCGTQCAKTFCNANPSDPQQGDACDNCLMQQDQACGQVAETACASDANCAALLACENTAKCWDKAE